MCVSEYDQLNAVYNNNNTSVSSIHWNVESCFLTSYFASEFDAEISFCLTMTMNTFFVWWCSVERWRENCGRNGQTINSQHEWLHRTKRSVWVRCVSWCPLVWCVCSIISWRLNSRRPSSSSSSRDGQISMYDCLKVCTKGVDMSVWLVTNHWSGLNYIFYTNANTGWDCVIRLALKNWPHLLKC